MDGLSDKFGDLNVALEIEHLLAQDQSSLDPALTAKVVSDKIVNPKSLL